MSKKRMARPGLLAQAMAVPTRGGTPPTKEDIDLALAFLRGEVTTAQVGTVVKQPSGGGARNWVLTTLQRAVRNGLVRLEAA